MDEFNSDLAKQLMEIGRESSAEAAAAFDRALGGTFNVLPQSAGSYEVESRPDDWEGAGLTLLMSSPGFTAVVFLPESTGLLPEWYRKPDPNQRSLLLTLAQELAATLLPEQYLPERVEAGHLSAFAETMTRCGLADRSQHMIYELSNGSESGSLYLAWPIDSRASLFDRDSTATRPVEQPAQPVENSDKTTTTETQERSTTNVRQSVERFEQLPGYAKSLLKIQVPVVVNLASTKRRVDNIVDLEIGTIIQFEKSCDETLTLEIGNCEIGEGEAVKIGEKFGLRITSLRLPGEKFESLQGPREDSRAAG